MSKARFTDKDDLLLVQSAGTIYGLRNMVLSLASGIGVEKCPEVQAMVDKANRMGSAISKRYVEYEFRFTMKKLIQGIFLGYPLRYIKAWTTDPDWGQGGG